MSELIFTKDGITVRTQVNTPLVGETFHKEKLPYEKLPVDGVQITITSIGREVDEAGKLRSLTFKFRDLGSLGPSSAPDQAVDIELTSGSLRHGYFNLASEVRRFFPGYKIPFTLRDGNREFPVHVTSGVAGTKPGDPEQGIQIVGGLQEFFGRHHAKPGDKVRITAMQPGKTYNISFFRAS